MCDAMNLDILRVLGVKPPKVQKARDPNAVEEVLPDPVVVQIQQAVALMRSANDIIIAPGYVLIHSGIYHYTCWEGCW